MKVMIADDSQIMRKIIRANLSKVGIEKVLECGDGATACKTLAANPDTKLLFTDLNMPQLNGFDLIKQIRSLPKLRHLEIIVISDHLSSTSEKTLEPYGIKGFVPKPFNLQAFNDIAVPIIDNLKNPREGGVQKLDLVSMQSLITSEKPEIKLDATGLTIAFSKSTIKLTLEDLLASADVQNN